MGNRLLGCRLFLLLLLGLGASAQINADVELRDGTILPGSPLWIVSYIEVAPDDIEEAKRLIVKHAQVSREDAGNLRFEVMQRIGRQNHFVVLEAWSDPASQASHTSADHKIAYRHALQPLLYSPYDERFHVGLETADAAGIPKGDSNTVYAITHADLSPPEQFAPCNRRPNPEGPCGNDLITGIAIAGRSHQGNMRFDVLTQINRANHMTVVEMWRDSDAQAAHQSHPERKNFRDALLGIEEGSGVSPDPQYRYSRLIGSLWDERLYRLIESD